MNVRNEACSGGWPASATRCPHRETSQIRTKLARSIRLDAYHEDLEEHPCNIPGRILPTSVLITRNKATERKLSGPFTLLCPNRLTHGGVVTLLKPS
jgi:hypothetical protein